ncbi:A24 family peptidase [Kineococcus aurantiacus]
MGAGILGLLVGSFLNVVAHRVPLGESVVRPASRCPGCRTEIRRRDNIPVLSWVLLRGRCRVCSSPISVRYPLVELATALLFAGIAALVGLTWALPAYLYLAGIAVPLALIDLQVRRLPDQIVLPSYAVALVLLTVASAGTGDWAALLRALVGGVSLFALYALIFVVKPGGMGLGDVKLAGVLGLYLAWWGWDALAVGGFLAFLIGGLIAVGLILFTSAGRRSKMPFGPAMLAGAFLALIVAAPVGDWYLGLTGLST